MSHIALETSSGVFLLPDEMPTAATSDARSIAATPNRKIDATTLEELLSAIRSDPSIQSLELRRVGLTPSFAVQLADFLETNTTLTALDVSGNSIGEHGARCLAASLGRHANLQRISLAACGLGADAVAAWKEYVCAHPQSPLSAIDLSNNQLDDECAASLGALVAAAQPPCGASIDLRNNELSDNSWRLIAQAAVTNRRLLSLRLEGNSEETSTASLARRSIDAALHRNERLRRHRTMLTMLPEIQRSSLNLMSCKIEYVELTITDSQLLSDALQSNRSITELRLRDNALSPEGTRRIFAALERHVSLTRLSMMDNNPGDLGLLAASRLVRQSATLETLYVANSRQIEPSTIKRLTAAHWHHTMARDATTTRELTLGHCGLTDLDIGVIVSGIATSCQIHYLNLRGNGITDRIVHVFVRMIDRCQHLRHLDISDNHLTLTGILPVVAAVQRHTGLRTLCLGRFDVFDRQILQDIAGRLMHNTSLHRLELATRPKASRCADLLAPLLSQLQQRRLHAASSHDAQSRAFLRNDRRLKRAQYRAIVHHVALQVVSTWLHLQCGVTSAKVT